MHPCTSSSYKLRKGVSLKMLNTGRWTRLIRKERNPTGHPVGFPVGAPTLGLNRPSILGHRLLGTSVCRHQQTVATCIILAREHPPDRLPSTVSSTACSTAGLTAKSYAPQATHHKIHPPTSLPPVVASARTFASDQRYAGNPSFGVPRVMRAVHLLVDFQPNITFKL